MKKAKEYTIRNEYDYNRALVKIDDLWYSELGTTAGDELEMLITIVVKYEDEHFPIS